MNDQDRASLAEQLLSNPLWDELFSEIERQATESCIYAETDEQRLVATLRVKEVRTLRSDCEAKLRSTRERKAAPA